MKKIISLILVLVCTFSAFGIAGCQEPEQEVTNEIVLADFEQWKPDFQLLRLFNNFGKVTRNDNLEFVKSGKYSAKLQTVGSTINNSKPLMYVTAISKLFEYDYRDFTEYNEVVVYVYNTFDVEKEVTVGLVTGVVSEASISTAQGQTFVLKPKAWTRIDYWLNVDFLNLFVDLENVEGVYFEFENTGNMYVDEKNVYYIDDLKLVKAEQKQEINDVITVDEWEVCSFEKDYQNFIATTELAAPEAEAISISVVNSAEYNLPESFGKKALKCVVHPTTDSSQSSSKIVLPGKLLQKTKMTTTSSDDYKKTYFKFDMFTFDELKGYTQLFTPWFGTGKGGNGSYITPLLQMTEEQLNGKDKSEGALQYKDYNRTVYNGTFNTLTQLEPREGLKTNQIQTWYRSFYEIAYAPYCKPTMLTNPGFIKIWVKANNTGKDITIFFDNFRVETGEEVYVRPVEEE